MTNVLVIPHLKIHNANALSSPFTIGFPAMTAWLGACHAMQRKLNQHDHPKLMFKSVGICCHDMQLHTYKGPGDYEYSIIGTGNPLDKTGSRSAFIEESRCSLEVSLVIECAELGLDDVEFREQISDLLHSGLKIAGGDILSFKDPLIRNLDSEAEISKFLRQLMPGYVLLERRDLMIESMQAGRSALDSLLDYLKVMHRCQTDESEKIVWTSKRKADGWLVPIATGFHGISPLGHAENQRDPITPHRFAESVITLGEFVMAYRIKNIQEMLWHYHVELENNLYLCQSNTYLQEKNHG